MPSPAEQTLHDTPDEMKRLEEFPMANFLLEDRTLWLVRGARVGGGEM